jgi:flagellar hook-associated protein 1 FlgK
VGPAQTYASQNNTGTGSVTLSIADIGGLEASAYLLSFDGATYNLTSVAAGNSVALTGSGSVADPFLADGMSFVINGAPAAGDLFRLEPVTGAAGSLAVAITDTRGIAAAAPIRTSADIANTGTAAISAGEVVDIADPGLLTPNTIQFIDANNYSINGAGSFAYAPGADIVINGARAQITGVAAAGDTFVIEPNLGGVGDNRNGLRLAGVGVESLMVGGTTSLLEGAGRVVGQVGSQVLRSTSERDVQSALLSQVQADLDSVTGVNLDEEAADLLRYQQAYQAAARTIAVADGLFQTLLQALR